MLLNHLCVKVFFFNLYLCKKILFILSENLSYNQKYVFLYMYFEQESNILYQIVDNPVSLYLLYKLAVLYKEFKDFVLNILELQPSIFALVLQFQHL